MKILVFQQNNSGEGKIAGIRRFGGDRFDLEVFGIDDPVPPVVEDGSEYFPEDIQADVVLDFLKHPDLSQDLGRLCSAKGIPVVASGKKHGIEGVFIPRT